MVPNSPAVCTAEIHQHLKWKCAARPERHLPSSGPEIPAPSRAWVHRTQPARATKCRRPQVPPNNHAHGPLVRSGGRAPPSCKGEPSERLCHVLCTPCFQFMMPITVPFCILVPGRPPTFLMPVSAGVPCSLSFPSCPVRLLHGRWVLPPPEPGPSRQCPCQFPVSPACLVGILI